MSNGNQPVAPSLLVPVALEALVITTDLCNNMWSITPKSYQGLQNFDPLASGAFTGGPIDSSASSGVLLHWALPSALTHGRRPADDQPIEFPLTPNRWLVVRRKAGADAAWVVLSDRLDNTNGANQYPNANPTANGAQMMGVHMPLSQFPGEGPSQPPLFLRAIGPGDATWAAYCPNVRDVFSFRDAMLMPDGQDVPPGPVTYQVFGWYSDSQSDPLHGWTTEDDWQSLMRQLKWYPHVVITDAGAQAASTADWRQAVNSGQVWLQSYGVTPGPDIATQLPSRTLCHGMVFALNWPGRGGTTVNPVPNFGPTDQPPEIAVGNSTTDALAAFFQKELGGSDGGIAEIVQAFQNDLLNDLDQPDGSARVFGKAAQAWFGGLPGGTRWELVAGEKAEQGQPTQWPDGAAGVLQSLNQAQRQLDGIERALPGQQQEVYSLWWKYGVTQNALQPSIAAFADVTQAALNQAVNTVVQTLLALPSARANRDALESQLKALLIPGSNLQLVKQGCARFWQATDPVILIRGVGRGFKHGDDGRFLDDGLLFCRFSGQTMSSIDVTWKGSQIQLNSDTLGITTLGEGLFPEFGDLCIEGFLLDTGNAPAIARAALSRLDPGYSPADVDTLAATVAIQQTLVWNADASRIFDRRTVAEASGLNGTIPSLVSVAAWRQPWSPLFLDWKVEWRSSYTDATQSLAGWNFGEVLAGADYSWGEAEPSGPGIQFSGRTLLTPQPSRVLFQRLQAFLQDQKLHPIASGRYLSANGYPPGAPVSTAGNLTLTLGNAAGNTTYPITLGDRNQLQGLVDAINYLEMGASASITAIGKDPTLQRLALTCDPTIASVVQLTDNSDSGGQNLLVSTGAMEAEELNAVLEKLRDVDLLAQTISGMSRRLITLNLDVQAPPDSQYPVTTDLFPAWQAGSDYAAGAFAVNNNNLYLTVDGGTSGTGAGPQQPAGASVDGTVTWLYQLPMTMDQLVGDGARGLPAPDPGVGAFLPVRAGHLRLVDLWVVDDFGQVLQVNKTGLDLDHPIRGMGLTAPNGGALVQMPPRLVQAGRLKFDLISAQDDQVEANGSTGANPVCGWLLPNHLDYGITVYDATGNMAGELVTASDGGTSRIVVWQPVPGSDAPVGAAPQIQNPHLAAFVAGLLNHPQSAAAFQELFENVDSTLWTLDPLGPRDNEYLSVLLGRPIAVIRGRIGMEFYGGQVWNQLWPATGAQDTGGAEKISFPVRLGNHRVMDNGLHGFFLGEDYSRFLRVMRAPNGVDPLPDGVYAVNRDPSLQFSGPTQWITMLADPRGSLYARAGVLPVQTAMLDPRFVKESLSRMDVTFRTGPILTDPQSVRMPLPAGALGRWSWLQRSGVTMWPKDPAPIGSTDTVARLTGEPLRVREGWLKLESSMDGRNS